MGVAKGSTLPRSGAPPPAADLRPPTAAHTHPHHTHAGSGGGGEERDQLLAGERHQRFLDGIDNPALVDDAHMPSYRGPAGGGMHTAAHPSIPPEGTLAGVLPSHPHQRPCESPFLSRPPYRPPTLQQHQTTSQHHPANSQHHPATSQHHPATSQHHPAASQHHPATSNQQTAFTRETWVRSSHGQFSGIVEIHPHQSHLQMNGHASQHHATTPGHIPNGNTHVHAGSHPDGPYSHSIGHHSHMNGHQDSVHSHNSQNNRTAGPVDDNHANNSQERDDPHKDDKWGSLTRGLAARKYQHLKEKLSSKFSRGDKPDDRTASSQADGKTMTSQGTNTQAISSSAGMNASGSSQQDASGIQAEPSRDSSRIAKLNTSFRKAIHQSSQKTNLQEATMETSLSTNQEQGGLSQHGGVLPPHYSRTPSQYQSQQPLAGPGLPPATHRAALPPPMSSPNLSRQHQHDPLGRGLANRRSGSYHHLAQLRQEPPSWRSHHYSVENLVDAHALPSDHTYSGPAVSSGHSQTTGGEGVGSGGSDSGRGTAGSGGESRVPNTLDTSLDSAASQRQNNQGHSSGNDSEWVDMTDAELQHIMKKGSDGKTNGGLVRRESLAATPPLPPLSPEGTPHPSPRSSPPRHRKYSLSYSCNGLNKPDLLEAAGRDGGKRTSQEGRAGSSSQNSSQSTPRRGGTSQMQQAHSSSKGTSTFAGSNHRSLGVPTIDWSHRKEDERQRSNSYDPLSKNKSIRVNMGPSGGELDTGDMTSTTDALDLDSMLDGVTEATTDDDATSACDPDVHLIRKQLEGLEGMYSEVLKLLGGRRKGRHTIGNGVGLGDLKTSHRRLHGSLSSLPSSIVSSRPGRDKRRVIDDRVRKIGRDGGGKSIHKRFQRLESHVVTLARSVAHLSSEMRTQHLMFQEIESIRGELSALRTGGSGSGAASNTNRNGGHVSWESFRAGIPGLSNPSRVKKLTQFFGDEPPLVRIFLRKLGYEKYAGLFEQEKIGMLELPYLTEERLQKIGIPMGPRLRILQEAQGPIRKEGNLSVYVV